MNMPPKNETKAVEGEVIDGATGEVVTGEVVEQAAEQGSEGEQPKSVQTDGVRARRAFMLKQFIPNADWINQNIVAKGKGTQVTVGRIFGFVTGVSRKTNTLPDGLPSESIVCSGILQSENYLDGELAEASTVYLPMAYAEKIESTFKMFPTLRSIEIDCDIGLEATGKTIPYEWVVTAFREGEQMDVLKRLKQSRGRPATAPALAAPAETKALPST